jgi:hypothetical protein
VFLLVVSTYTGCTRELAVTHFGFGIPFVNHAKNHLLLCQNTSIIMPTLWKSANQLIICEICKTANKEQDTMTTLPSPGNDSTDASTSAPPAGSDNNLPLPVKPTFPTNKVLIEVEGHHMESLVVSCC